MIKNRCIFVEGKETRKWVFDKERYEGHEVIVGNKMNVDSFVLKPR